MAAPQPLRVVVTGGAGFVGRNLCQRLLSQGHFVISVDSFLSSREEDSERLKQSPSFRLIEWDISEDQAGLKAAIEGKFGEMAGLVGEGRKGIDQIYNLACPASPPTYQAYPFITMKTNFTGAMNMLELAKEYGATILQASTSEIYGEPQVHPQVEEYWGNVNTIGVRSCYDEGKRIAETLFSEYHRQYGTDIRIVRIFNTYGPEMHPFDGRVVSNFIIQALSGRDISIYGDGQQTRSFLFVSDLVEGLVRMMNTPVGPEPINLGNPDEFTVRELADLVLELIESPSKIIFEPPVSDDPSRRKPDITRARTRLHGWEPTVKLRDGLSKTIEYFRQLDLSLYKKFPGVPSFVQALKQ